ncbi:MAG: restriction endonuclease [Myxococcota bacterium]
MRTDSRARDFIAAELKAGRLRQGWGHEANQDLRVIHSTPRADRVAHQHAAWRGNRRLLEATGDGLQLGDVVVFPNVPEPGRWAFARITGGYRYEIDANQGDYGHIREVEPWLTGGGELAWVVPNHELVPAPMRRSMTCRSRMWSVDAFGEAIELVLSALEKGQALTDAQSPDERFSTFVGSMRSEAYKLVDHGWGAAELEDLVVRVLRNRYRASHPNARVDPKGGTGEHGIDVLVTLPDPLGVSLKIGVQVKKHEGVETGLRSLEQIAEAREYWGIHAGIVLTTATEVSEEYEAKREALTEELGIDVQVLCRGQFVDLVLEHVAAESSA